MPSLDKTFLKSVSKTFGEKAVGMLADRPPLRAVSTGSIAINHSIGPYCPGYPLGRLSQIYGGESAGKSLLACQALGQAQQAGLPTFLVDRENHYTPEWFERFGGSADETYDLHPDTIEHCFAMISAACKAITEEGLPGGLFVIDSLSSLPTEKSFADDSGSGQGLAAVARYLSENLSSYVQKIGEAGLGMIVVGQIRVNPDPFARREMREYTPGGNALAHYSVLRLKARLMGPILEKDLESGEEYRVGFVSSVETYKNDVGGMAPHKFTEVDFYDGSGSDDTRALFPLAKRLGIIEQNGAWFHVPSVGGKFQGQKQWPTFLQAHPELYEPILEAAFDPSRVLQHEMSRITDSGEAENADEEVIADGV